AGRYSAGTHYTGRGQHDCHSCYGAGISALIVIVAGHHWLLTRNEVVAPVSLSVVVTFSSPLPMSAMLIRKLSVSSVPGMRLPLGPMILAVAAVVSRLIT